MEATKHSANDNLADCVEASNMLRRFLSKKNGSQMPPPASLSPTPSSTPIEQSPCASPLLHNSFRSLPSTPRDSLSIPSTPSANNTLSLNSSPMLLSTGSSMVQLEMAAQQLERHANRRLKRQRSLHPSILSPSIKALHLTGNRRSSLSLSLSSSPLLFNNDDTRNGSGSSSASSTAGSMYSTSSEEERVFSSSLSSSSSSSIQMYQCNHSTESALPLRILTQVKTRFCLPPSSIFRPRLTVESILDKRLLQYCRDFFDGSVLLAYENLKLARSGAIHNGSPQIVLKATFDALIFRPRVGTTITGNVNKIGEGHIGMLVAGIFNASIPASEGISKDYLWKLGKWIKKNESLTNDTISSISTIDTSSLKPNQISIGTEVTFEVKRVSVLNGLFSITGYMLDDEDLLKKRMVSQDSSSSFKSKNKSSKKQSVVTLSSNSDIKKMTKKRKRSMNKEVPSPSRKKQPRTSLSYSSGSSMNASHYDSSRSSKSPSKLSSKKKKKKKSKKKKKKKQLHEIMIPL
jgi:DNA-directed RNA polymerase subunit E'/Rpb7